MNKKIPIVLRFSKKKAKSKMFEMAFYALIMLLTSFFLSAGDFSKLAFVFSVVSIVVLLPMLILHLNYLKHDKGKKVIFDYPNNSFKVFKNGKFTSEIKISEIKLITHNIGTVNSNYRKLPHMDYYYYKICTKTEVFVYTSFTESTKFYFQSNAKSKFSFFNLINFKNDYLIAQSKIIKKSNNINDYIDSMTLKFIKKYESKTTQELKYILDNKTIFQPEAIKAAEFVLKGR